MFLRDLNVAIPASDGRRIEFIAHELPCRIGIAMAKIAKLRSVVGRICNTNNDAAAKQARTDKEAKYQEFVLPVDVLSLRCALQREGDFHRTQSNV